MLFAPADASFVSVQFLVLNLDGWFVVSSLLFITFWYSIIIYYYIILRSSTSFCFCSGEIYFSLSISCSFVYEIFYVEVFGPFVILSEILIPIKLPVTSAVFCIALFEAVLSALVADCLAISRSFWLYLLLTFFTYIFANIFTHIFRNVCNSTKLVNSLMNITIDLKFIFIIDAFREYNSHLQDITS